MAVAHGQFDKFDLHGSETFPVYLERLEFYFTAKGIVEDGKKKATLLSEIGSDTYQLVRNLCTPDLPNAKSYAQITKLLSDHLAPTPNTIMERFVFNSRIRKEGESVTDFIASLRSLSRNCKSEDIQKKLLSAGSVNELTLDKAKKIALGM